MLSFVPEAAEVLSGFPTGRGSRTQGGLHSLAPASTALRPRRSRSGSWRNSWVSLVGPWIGLWQRSRLPRTWIRSPSPPAPLCWHGTNVDGPDTKSSPTRPMSAAPPSCGGTTGAPWPGNRQVRQSCRSGIFLSTTRPSDWSPPVTLSSWLEPRNVRRSRERG